MPRRFDQNKDRVDYGELLSAGSGSRTYIFA